VLDLALIVRTAIFSATARIREQKRAKNEQENQVALSTQHSMCLAPSLELPATAMMASSLLSHPPDSVGSLVLGLRCSWCGGSAPMPRITGLHSLQPGEIQSRRRLMA
jgi:hypothetical protein